MREKEFLPNVRDKLGIEELNEMQRVVMEAASRNNDVILLSPTGSGKTLAFTLFVLKLLKEPGRRLQCVVIAPSRELVIQIAGVMRTLATGYKVTEIYGGHKTEDEINSLKITPDIIVATPGRLVDHLKRRTADVLDAGVLVLDEFDKSLELGFEDDMKKIIKRMKNLNRVILTSATQASVLPEFLSLTNPETFNFTGRETDARKRMCVHRVDVYEKDKLQGLVSLIKSLHADKKDRMIVFVNHRESVERTVDYLKRENVSVMGYHGALDQHEREMAVAAFNNGSCRVLVATDLAARGLDIENVEAIIHYHQALTPETFVHRNGRTARVDREGDIYVMIGPEEDVKEWTEFDNTYYPNADGVEAVDASMTTLYFSAGKKEKLSKGDILGFLIKQCGMESSEVGRIDVRDHYSLVAIDASKKELVIETARKEKVKGKRVKITDL